MPGTKAPGIWIADRHVYSLYLMKQTTLEAAEYEYLSINQMMIWMLNHNVTGHLNIEPFDKQTNPHELNTKLVCYSDPHCKGVFSVDLVCKEELIFLLVKLVKVRWVWANSQY